jgi:hypothetical protein
MEIVRTGKHVAMTYKRGRGNAMNIHQKRRRLGRLGAILTGIAVLVSAAIVTSGASARQAAAPQSTSQPSIAGQVREGRTVTAENGRWNNSPTGFTYQWQQCDSTGAGCNPISGATSKTYTVATADVDHTLKVAVTATNADGSSTATSQASSVVSSNKGPVNTASPSISGTAKVGEQLSASTGTWTGGVKSFSYQWQQCDSSGNSCNAVQDATAKTYGVRSVDSGKTLRVVVTATNLAGSSSATASPTAVVTNGSAPAPTPVTRNHAPTITFRSLKRVGHRIYARFSLCDDGTKNVTVIEHDVMAGRLGYTRRFSIAPRPCGTHAKNWMLIPRFRHTGRFTATLRAVDKSGASSRTVSRSLRFHAV